MHLSSLPEKNLSWAVVGASVPGASHLQQQLPCQDAHFYEVLPSGWGVAIIADGAGSAEKAHLGAQFLAQETGLALRKLLLEPAWVSNKTLPEQDTWQALVKGSLLPIKQKLDALALRLGIALKELSATLLGLIFGPSGLLALHIGDGRSAYQDAQGNWHALTRPWKGEYANETVFFASDIWSEDRLDQYLNTRRVEGSIQAFALLSDGCERHSFVCNVWQEEEKRFVDPNTPFPNFFNPLVANLRQMYQKGTQEAEMKEKWEKFLKEGHPRLKTEPDDKTMVLGVFIPSPKALPND
ncbi:MAG: protein phosphatase 2C domain-containing protein [Microscillaceae bacterium]|nr:protein phosphatase 2C domain-containing protein [Microscillaceae bacterium]